MGLIDYMSRNLVGLPIPPSVYDEEFVVAAINTFINNLEMIDNVILNQLANQNKAPCDLIKKRAENKGLLDAETNSQLITKHSKHSAVVNCYRKTKVSLTQTLLEVSQHFILLKISQHSRIQKSQIQQDFDQRNSIQNKEPKRHEILRRRIHSIRIENHETMRSNSFG